MKNYRKSTKNKQRNNSLSNKSLNSCFNNFFVVQTKNIHSTKTNQMNFFFFINSLKTSKQTDLS